MNVIKQSHPVMVKLNPDQIRYAAIAGTERMIDVIKNKRPNVYGEDDSLCWQRHVEGALAEYAVASWLGANWIPHHGTVDKPDIEHRGAIIEVRSTMKEGGHLLLKKNDPEEAIFILAIGVRGSYRLAGWILAGDGKRPWLWEDKANNGRPCYWVPQSVLNSMKDLI